MSPPTPGARAGAGTPRGRRLPHGPPRHALALAVLCAAAVAFGRTTRPEGASLALAWPAAAVGCCWLAAAWGRRRRALAATLGLTVVTALAAALTGATPALATGLAIAGAVQAALACAVLQHWQQRSSSVPWTLRRTSDLTGLVLAACAGSLAAAALGAAALHLWAGAPLAATAGTWALRDGVSTLVVAAAALRLSDRGLERAFRDRRQVLEAGAATTAVLATCAAVLGVHVGFALLLLPLALWIALRFDTTVSALHTLLVGAVVVVATHDGWGTSAGEPVATRVLTAQACVAGAGLLCLLLALQCDERRLLVVESQEAHTRADEQAELLGSVLANMREGVALVDADGRFLVRNAAAEQLTVLRADPDGGPASLDTSRLFSPRGRPVTRRQMADTRALAGEQVDEDYVLRLAPGRDRTLSVRGTPLTTSRGRRQALLIFTDVTSQRRAAREVAEARDLFAGVLDAAGEFAIVSTDLDFRITLFNAGAERMLGYDAAEVVGGDLLRLHTAEEIGERARELGVTAGPSVAVGSALAGDTETRQWTYVRRDGSRLQVSLTVSAMRDRTGAVTGYMGLARDVTAQLAAAADLADSTERFRLTFATAPVGMVLLSLGVVPGTVLEVNAAMPALLGREEHDVVGAPLSRFCHPEDVEAIEELLRDAAAGSTTSERTDRRFQRADGETVWARTSVSVACPHRGEAYLICLVEDVTARKVAEQALQHQALHDPLTGLPNRALFGDRLEHALAAARRSGHRVGVLFLDLDGFKAVNDTAGHAAGDELLQRVSDRVRECVRPGDTVARLGGDEFAVVCPGIDTVDEATAVAQLQVIGERVLGALRRPVLLRAGTFGVGVSIGLVAATAGTPREEVLHAADEAMYAAKRGGKNRVSVSRGAARPRSAGPAGAPAGGQVEHRATTVG